MRHVKLSESVIVAVPETGDMVQILHIDKDATTGSTKITYITANGTKEKQLPGMQLADVAAKLGIK